MPYPSGAGLVEGSSGWLLDDRPNSRSAGRFLLWAAKHELAQLTVILDGLPEGDPDLPGDLARRCSFFVTEVVVVRVVGTSVEPVCAAPSPMLRSATVVDPDIESVMTEAGVDLVVEGHEVHGEVLGLEVARVAGDPPELQVGVGRFDREITAMLYADLQGVDALRRASMIVADHRYPGAPPHPMQSMGRERWLRHHVIGDPSIVGADLLRPVPSTIPVPNLRDPHPAMASGLTGDGRPLLVGCGLGVDLDLVPLAADTRAAIDPAAELVLVVPRGELLRPLRELADHLRVPARWVELDPPWVGSQRR